MAKQVLVVWNPSKLPETIKEHVEVLRGGKGVWWGKIDGKAAEGVSAEEARSRWPELAGLADERLAEGKPLLVYATNHRELHVLLVREVIFGSDAPLRDGYRAPWYYSGHTCALWFAVEDIQSISFEPGKTLDCLLNLGFDPYASGDRQFPLMVESAEDPFELFSDEALRARAGDRAGDRAARRFAELQDTIFPPLMREASLKLATQLDGVWMRLDEASRIFLASGWVLRSGTRDLEEIDRSAPFLMVAKAVERELTAALEEPVKSLSKQGGPWAAEAASWLTRSIRGPSVSRKFGIGDCLEMLKHTSSITALLGLRALERIVSDAEMMKWLDNFRGARNDAGHARPLDDAKAAEHWGRIFESQPSGLLPLVQLKEEMREAMEVNSRRRSSSHTEPR